MAKLFSIFDNKAESYSPPFAAATKGLATRMFADLVNDRSTAPGKYPQDFKLVEIGCFDEMTGNISGYTVFESLGFGSDYLKTDRD